MGGVESGMLNALHLEFQLTQLLRDLSGTFQKGVQFARDDWRSRLVNDENLDRYQSLLAYLSDLGREKGSTSGQVALAWVLQRKPYIVPIPGMRSVARLTENAKATEITLTAEEMKKIDELSSGE